MRLTNHVFYALAALIGVSLMALQEPSVGLLVAQQVDGGAQQTAACRDDRLDRPCNPIRGGILRDGDVIAR